MIPGLSGPAPATCTLGFWERRDGASAGCHHSFGPKSVPSQPCHVESVPLRLFPPCPLSFFRSGDAHTDVAWASASAALTLSVSWLSLQSQWRFIFLLTSLLCGRELPAPAFLKACHGLQAQEAGKRKHVKAARTC